MDALCAACNGQGERQGSLPATSRHQISPDCSLVECEECNGSGSTIRKTLYEKINAIGRSSERMQRAVAIDAPQSLYTGELDLLDDKIREMLAVIDAMRSPISALMVGDWKTCATCSGTGGVGSGAQENVCGECDGRGSLTAFAALKECDWPETRPFSFFEEPGEHEPCYVVMPCGGCLQLNHHAGEGVDIARAKFIIAACNAALNSVRVSS